MEKKQLQQGGSNYMKYRNCWSSLMAAVKSTRETDANQAQRQITELEGLKGLYYPEAIELTELN